MTEPTERARRLIAVVVSEARGVSRAPSFAAENRLRVAKQLLRDYIAQLEQGRPAGTVQPLPALPADAWIEEDGG